jgi:hypothetical protein
MEGRKSKSEVGREFQALEKFISIWKISCQNIFHSSRFKDRFLHWNLLLPLTYSNITIINHETKMCFFPAQILMLCSPTCCFFEILKMKNFSFDFCVSLSLMRNCWCGGERLKIISTQIWLSTHISKENQLIRNCN